jgi:hypothetical protein
MGLLTGEFAISYKLGSKRDCHLLAYKLFNLSPSAAL